MANKSEKKIDRCSNSGQILSPVACFSNMVRYRSLININPSGKYYIVRNRMKRGEGMVVVERSRREIG